MDEILTWEQAVAVGVSEHELRCRIAAGDWVRLLRGWYATRPPVDAEDLHCLRLRAWTKVYDGRAVASHGSALLRLGLPLHEVDLATVHLSRLGEGRSKLAKGFHLHAASRTLEPVDGVEHPATAVLQVVTGSIEAGLVAADGALRRNLATAEQLAESAAGFGCCRGSVGMRQVVEHADGRHESPGETITALQLRLAGIEAVPQFVVPDTGRWTPSGQGYRADFRVVGTNVLVEFDGKAKYGRTPEDGGSSSLWAEKQREDQMRGLGWFFARPIWSDLMKVGRLEAKVRQAVRYPRRLDDRATTGGRGEPAHDGSIWTHWVTSGTMDKLLAAR